MTDKQFADYWASLVEKKHSAKVELSSDERLFYAANVLRGSVQRSGLIGYFENTEANVIHDAHHALAMLGLSEVLRLLQEGQKIVLNGQLLFESEQCVAFFDYDLPEEELEKAIDDLDKKVRGIQDQLYLQDRAFFDSLCRFADERSLGIPKG